MEISELRLKTHKLNSLRDFYAGTMEFSLLEDTDDHIVLDAGATRLMFEQDMSMAHYYHFAFNIPHNQFADAKAWLAQRTPLLTFEGEDEIEWSAWDAQAVYFQDPAGNVGELIARRTLDNASDLPFSGQSIRRVSEIGLAVSDVPVTTELLVNRFDLPIYDGGGEIFCAMGDADGLLILVKVGRPWFPTQTTRASQSPIHMTLRSNRADKWHIPNTNYVITTTDASSG